MDFFIGSFNLNRDQLETIFIVILQRRFQRFWVEEVKRKGTKNASVGKVIFRTVRTKTIVFSVLLVLSLLLEFVGPVRIIKY